MRLTRSHLHHHARFYVAIALGIVVLVSLRLAGGPQPVVAAGDAFFFAYLASAARFIYSHTPADLKRRAAGQDEGILIVVTIALGVIALNVTSVFLALNSGGKLDTVSLVLLLAGVPLGWCALHTISAFHYANIFYFDPPGAKTDGRALEFPGTDEPDLWDFLYFAFVIGMTAQVSDVQVRTGDMRKAVTAHSVVSFFFNTVLIALVINVVAAH